MTRSNQLERTQSRDSFTLHATITSTFSVANTVWGYISAANDAPSGLKKSWVDSFRILPRTGDILGAATGVGDAPAISLSTLQCSWDIAVASATGYDASSPNDIDFYLKSTETAGGDVGIVVYYTPDTLGRSVKDT